MATLAMAVWLRTPIDQDIQRTCGQDEHQLQQVSLGRLAEEDVAETAGDYDEEESNLEDLPLQHIKSHAASALVVPDPRDDSADDRLLKPVKRFFNARVAMDQIGEVLDGVMPDIPRSERDSIIASVVGSPQFNAKGQSINFDARSSACLVKYFISSLRHKDRTISVSVMYGGVDFQVSQVVAYEERTLIRHQPYDCNCHVTVMQQRSCDICLHKEQKEERIPVFRPTYVSQEHFKAVFDRAVRAVAQEVALLPSRAAGNMIGDV
jgi:hypothetical protein